MPSNHHSASRQRQDEPKPAKLGYRFAPLPVAAINDAGLSDGAFRVYAHMLSIREANECRISERTLAKRLHRSPRTAHSLIHQLIDAGYIVPMNVKAKSLGRFRIVAISAANGFSSPTNAETNLLKISTPSAANGFSKSAANGFSHSRGVGFYSESPGEKKNVDRAKGDFDRLARVLEELVRNRPGSAADVSVDREVGRLLNRWPLPYQRRLLIEHLRAGNQMADLRTVSEVITYADHKTGRGDRATA